MVLERHHSRRICLMLLALDTPKLWDRFSLGLESTGLGRLHMSRRRTRIRERVSLSNKLVSTVIPMVPECSIPLHVQYLFPTSESSLSKIDRRAWAPMLRGRVCDLTNSRLLSPTCPKDLSLLTSPSLQDRNTDRITQCKTYFTYIVKDVTFHSPVMLQQPRVGHRLSGGWICFLCKRQTVTVNHNHNVVVSNWIACVSESMAYLEGGEIPDLLQV